jgi:hypothetical protein
LKHLWLSRNASGDRIQESTLQGRDAEFPQWGSQPEPGPENLLTKAAPQVVKPLWVLISISKNSPVENLTDPVRKAKTDREITRSQLATITNLQLQVGQVILGASHLSAQDSAGPHCRFRLSFISRYQAGRQGYPVKERSFNALTVTFRHQHP